MGYWVLDRMTALKLQDAILIANKSIGIATLLANGPLSAPDRLNIRGRTLRQKVGVDAGERLTHTITE